MMLPLCVAMSLLKPLLKVDHDMGDVGASPGSVAESDSTETSDEVDAKYDRNSSSRSKSFRAISCTYAALVHTTMVQGVQEYDLDKDSLR